MSCRAFRLPKPRMWCKHLSLTSFGFHSVGTYQNLSQRFGAQEKCLSVCREACRKSGWILRLNFAAANRNSQNYGQAAGRCTFGSVLPWLHVWNRKRLQIQRSNAGSCRRRWAAGQIDVSAIQRHRAAGTAVRFRKRRSNSK